LAILACGDSDNKKAVLSFRSLSSAVHAHASVPMQIFGTLSGRVWTKWACNFLDLSSVQYVREFIIILRWSGQNSERGGHSDNQSGKYSRGERVRSCARCDNMFE
jgi:hypothetical protein